MELSVEAVAEHREVNAFQELSPLTREIESERTRLAAYFRRWKVPDPIADELIAIALSSAVRRSQRESKTRCSVLVMEEANKLLHQRFLSFNRDSNPNGAISEDERLAILWSGHAEKFMTPDSRDFDCEQAFEAGCKAAKLAKEPQRLPETNPMLMQTSLTHLPSFRMISGWFVLVTLIVLAFIFTR